MTFKELLKACASGEFPKVKYKNLVGHIVTIRNTGSVKGCSVIFLESDTKDAWFHADRTKDKRKHFMDELTLIPDA